MYGLLARVLFQKRDQLPGKNIETFIEKLRKLASKYKLGGYNKLPLDIVLRDRFVIFIKNEEL